MEYSDYKKEKTETLNQCQPLFVGVVARVEGLRGRMGESTRQVSGLFESLLSEAFNEH